MILFLSKKDLDKAIDQGIKKVMSETKIDLTPMMTKFTLTNNAFQSQLNQLSQRVTHLESKNTIRDKEILDITTDIIALKTSFDKISSYLSPKIVEYLGKEYEYGNTKLKK